MNIGELMGLVAEYGILIAIGVVYIHQSKKMQDNFIAKIDVIIDKLDRNSRITKMQDKQFMNIRNDLSNIDKKLEKNINGTKISLNAVVLEEITSLKDSLYEIIDHNHFKENINHLNTKIDNATNKFKTDLHSKVFQMTQDKRIVEVVDEKIIINDEIKKVFIEEIDKKETNYDFLKTRVESFLKAVRTDLIEAVYKFYEAEK